ncbi:MAG TPA: UDP-N-acetylmuramoyl-L-alanyl-D-glutamate--2,6-diaminopimelate ligase [Thermoanaerobaculia bacterium]|nr:UDP-N-acetylmuramoyl-L-alanyl-D-glutamate--2,6-diaminopimelate ligase [Thermoanaerobaculia bacterium]
MRFSELIAGIAAGPAVAPGPGPLARLEPRDPLARQEPRDPLARQAPRDPLARQAPRDPDITGVTHDSRRVRPGDLYVALPGQLFDGWDFAAAAVGSGAVAVAGAPPRDPALAAALGVPWAPLADPRAGLAALAARAYGHPDRELLLAGVTGTNGKTTVALLMAAMLEAAGLPAAFLGTLGYSFREHRFAGGHTTPESSDLYRTLRGMHAAGARAAAMEVSSHALAMQRVAGAAFDVAVFTNLTRDHLDYHQDMETYFAAKRLLFAQLKPGARPVVNADDPYGRRLADELPEALTFGDGGAVRASGVRLSAGGIAARLETPRGALDVASPLLGRYNLDNLLAAAAAAEALGLPHAAMARGIAQRRPVPGRMEPVDRGQPFPVFVDYAHTDAALAAALAAVREVAAGPGQGAGQDLKVAVVFGCGGERDPGKRSVMGRTAGELADLPIVTSDNPRSEDPLAIIAAVAEGVKASGNASYRLVPDRREAIRAALAAAGPGWAVLVAGKGHEREQIVGDRKLPFSDIEEIGRALEERFG